MNVVDTKGQNECAVGKKLWLPIAAALLSSLLLLAGLAVPWIAFGDEASGYDGEDDHYTITYVGCSIPEQTAAPGASVTLSYVPNETAKRFLHWATKPDGCVTYKAGSSLKVSSDMKLYPVWGTSCSPCGGTGKVAEKGTTTCTNCNGRGTFKKGGLCRSCLGFKYDKYKYNICTKCLGGNWGIVVPDCSMCGGTGKLFNVPCSTCNGSTYEQWEEQCGVCNGSGKLADSTTTPKTCSTCKGTGIGGTPTVRHCEVIDVEAIQPTCENQGRTEGSHCSECGVVLKKSSVLAASHDIRLMLDLEPTCTRIGWKEHYYCWNCLRVFRSENDQTPLKTPREAYMLPKASHKVSKWEVSGEATCMQSQWRYGDCSACGELVEQEIAPLDHSKYHYYMYTVNPDCNNGGRRYMFCDKCSCRGPLEDVPKLGHDYSESTITVWPTCGSEGSQKKVCNRCGDTVEEAIPAKGHTWSYSATTIKAPTCTETGIEANYCYSCNEIKPETKREIPATGHSWPSNYTTVKAATCTSSGTKVMYCAKCKKKSEEVIPAKGHTWSNNYTIDKKASCTESGSQSIHCRNCSVTKNSAEIAALGHAWREYTINATSKTEGETGFSCTRCYEKRDTVTTPKLPSISLDDAEIEGIGSSAVGGSSITATSKNPYAAKANNPIVAKGKAVVIKASKLKKGKQKVAAKKAFSVKKAQGAVSYKKMSGSKKVVVAKNGKVTIKKGLKKGTYKVRVKITAAGNKNWAAKSKVVTLKIKVK